MKKALTLTALVALIGAALVLSGCCGSGSCPFKARKDAALCGGCGAPKGSEACAAACKPAEKCGACGAVKGSPECAVACKV